MKIYSFWSGDCAFFTTSKSLKKAQEVGRAGMKHYLETCKHLGEEPDPIAGKEYFIPQEVEQIDIEWFKHLLKTDPDTLILEEALHAISK